MYAEEWFGTLRSGKPFAARGQSLASGVDPNALNQSKKFSNRSIPAGTRAGSGIRDADDQPLEIGVVDANR